jgi:hypothetical protein
MPRVNAGEQPTEIDLDEIRVLLASASYLIRLLGNTIEIAGAAERIRTSLADLQAIDVGGILAELRDQAHSQVLNGAGSTLPRRLLVPWDEPINTLRNALIDTIVERVTVTRNERERQFDVVLAAFGAILVAVLESVVLLGQRVVGPLALLGGAITRIAAGDRGIALNLQSGTREIAEMVTAVETLRQAAVIADATALRHQRAARQRFRALREALGIVQTVREPALALERGVARLSEGIDATIALVTLAMVAPPSTLGAAADAVRVGLADIRETWADLDATFAAACSAQTEDRPEAEFVAHILAVQAQVDRRSVAVRGFVQPSLVALRDAASVSGDGPAPVLRDLVSEQFEHIEESVATVASMLAAVSQAVAIVRDLPLEDDQLAA